MTTKNVAICFSPCLLRSEKASEADLIYASKGAILTEMMIDKFEDLFGDEEQQVETYRLSEKKQKENFEEEIKMKIKIEQENSGNKNDQ